ncbi:hypothetical protein HMI56_004973 [Coelomomyces lativittatus]|nr:hypothetical protein HMI56_004973 [Coelomomyces lativittatus]
MMLVKPFWIKYVRPLTPLPIVYLNAPRVPPSTANKPLVHRMKPIPCFRVCTNLKVPMVAIHAIQKTHIPRVVRCVQAVIMSPTIVDV